MPPTYFPLRWESTGDQWWFASPIDWAAANGHYDLVRELLHLDTNLLIKLTSLRRIRRLETVWDDDEEQQFDDVAKCRAQVAKKLLAECETKKGYNTLIRAGYGGWLLYTASAAGDLVFVKDLLERDQLLVFGEGEYGVSDMFYAAARSKNSEVFRILIESSLSPRSCNGGGEIIEGKGEEISSDFRWEIINRAVHASARGGNLEFLRELVGDCLDVLVYRDGQGSTILHTASGRGQIEVVKNLLSSYNIIDSTDSHGNTALHVAAYRGHLAVVELLISASPSLSLLTNNHGNTFLHMAVAGFRTPGFRRLDKQIQLVKQLVSGKILNLQEIINVRNNDGSTALHVAVTENIQSDLVELLMTVPSINLNIRDADGNTPLDLVKQGPVSASSEILIKRLISAGGVSNCEDQMTRNALVSHLKMQSGIGGSPGASFRIPDAEIFLYTGIDNESDSSCDFAKTEFTSCSGQLSYCGSAAGSNSLDNKKLHSVNKAAKRLKMLLLWTRRKERKLDEANSQDEISEQSYGLCSKLENNPIPLRQRFSRIASLPNNKRLSVKPTLPSPSTRMKFSAGLMHGVIQLMPQSSFGSPSSPFSDTSWASPRSVNKDKRMDFGSVNVGPSSPNSAANGANPKMKRKVPSLNIRLMNQYLCFGAQGLAVDDSIRYRQRNRDRKM